MLQCESCHMLCASLGGGGSISDNMLWERPFSHFLDVLLLFKYFQSDVFAVLEVLWEI